MRCKTILQNIKKLNQEEQIAGLKCSKCQNIIEVIVRQTRSADEGMTAFFHCPVCKVTKK
jgi:DNA-directed RNA polymerase subunit M/transcription elongation factor TFIIS